MTEMKRILRHWPILFMITACIFTLIVSYLLGFTDKLDAYDALDISLDCFLGVLPIGAFLTSVFYGGFHGGFKKIWIIPVCGILYIISYMAQGIPFETFVPGIEDAVACLQISMLAIMPAAVGLVFGSLTRLIVGRIGILMKRSRNYKNDAI